MMSVAVSVLTSDGDEPPSLQNLVCWARAGATGVSPRIVQPVNGLSHVPSGRLRF